MMNKQVLTYEKEYQISQQLPQPLVFSLSKYQDCLVVLINQTGAVGSILEGQVTESEGMQLQEQYEEDAEEGGVVFDIKVLFGSSEIQFYEVFLRRLMNQIWQQRKTKSHFRVLLNISLPVFSPKFKQQIYYQKMFELFKEGLSSVL